MMLMLGYYAKHLHLYLPRATQCLIATLACLDATHGTNHYDFKLVTVIFLDDHGEGIPCAWCISNKEDSAVHTAFFKALQNPLL
jgi:hypothetical protein